MNLHVVQMLRLKAILGRQIHRVARELGKVGGMLVDAANAARRQQRGARMDLKGGGGEVAGRGVAGRVLWHKLVDGPDGLLLRHRAGHNAAALSSTSRSIMAVWSRISTLGSCCTRSSSLDVIALPVTSL